MDQELIVYLDARFGEVKQQFREIDKRFEQIDKRFEQVDQRFEEVHQQIAQEIAVLRVETNQQLKVMNGAIQETRILLENMRGEVRLVAEAALGVDEKLGSFRKPLEEKAEEVLIFLRRLPPYAQLDGRVGALEDWRGRLGQDPIEVLRERYGPNRMSERQL